MTNEPDYVAKALEIATKAHEGQERWNGDPYITHPKRVGDMFSDPVEKAAGYLHDVLEDTDVTEKDLADAGIPPLVILIVTYVTKKKGESYADFILRICELGNAIPVKKADIKDNLSDLKNSARRDKYELALIVLESAGK